MCIQQVASSTIRVLSAPDTPHFTFDAVVDMSVQQEGVFAGMLPSFAHHTSHPYPMTGLHVAVEGTKRHCSSGDATPLKIRLACM